MANETIQKIELVTVELTEDILTPLREGNGEIQNLINAFGQIYLRKKELAEEMDKLEEGLQRAEADFKTKNDELRELVSGLEKEYPRGQIDLKEGTITWNPAVKEQMPR
jgi:replication-associated recombination protein RarA